MEVLYMSLYYRPTSMLCKRDGNQRHVDSFRLTNDSSASIFAQGNYKCGLDLSDLKGLHPIRQAEETSKRNS